MSNLKQLVVAVSMYAEDHDGRLPAADAWSKSVKRYLQKAGPSAPFVCPARAPQAASYAYNSRLSGLKLAQIQAPRDAPVVFESSLDYTNAFDQLQSFVAPHNGTGNVAFADGHVKALKAAPPANAGLK
jgi:prepilin-type processing-associated H-X9-DG protein